MKKNKTKDINIKKIIILVVIILLVVILLLLFLKPKKSEEKKIYKGWMENVSRMDYINVSDYSTNICGRKYYSPNFKLDDNAVLYSYGDNKLEDGMFTLISIRYGECDSIITFATSLNGKLYYINNFEDSNYKKLQLVLVPSVENIVNLGYDNDNNLIAFDSEGSEKIITEEIDEIVRN